MKRRLARAACRFLKILLCGCLLWVVGPRRAAVVAQEPTPARPFCGVQYATDDDLATVRSLGVTVVLQTFRHDGDPSEWLAQLDRAGSHGLQVIGRLWPEGWEWDGSAWQIDEQARRFVETLAAHPTTLAVYALHEPYWRGCRTCGLTTAQQQAFYRQLKAIADVPLYSEIGSITFWVERGTATALVDGVCDYCAVSYYPFFADGTYRRERFIERLEEDLAAIRELAPNSKLVWGMQVFAQSDSPEPRRMPTAEEIADIGAIVAQRDVDGIFWYVWQFGPLYDDFLSNHPELFDAVAGVPACASTLPTAAAAPTPTNGATPTSISSASGPGASDPSAATATIAPGPTSTHPPEPTLAPIETTTPQNRADHQKNLCGLANLLGVLPLAGLALLAYLGRIRGRNRERAA